MKETIYATRGQAKTMSEFSPKMFACCVADGSIVVMDRLEFELRIMGVDYFAWSKTDAPGYVTRRVL